MRILASLGACVWLCAGCGLLVSFDGLSDGSANVIPNVPDGGPADGPPDDAVDAPDAAPRGAILVRRLPEGHSLRGIAVGLEDIYWVEKTPQEWGVYKAAKGDDAGSVAKVTKGIDVYDVAVSGDYVYWSDGASVGRMSLADASVREEHYVSPGATALYLAVDLLGHVYVSTPSGIAVGPCSSADMCRGANPGVGMQTFIPFPFVRGAGIALEGNHLIWGHDLPVGVTLADKTLLEKAPTSEVDHQTPPEPVSGVATDGKNVYWIAGDRAIVATPTTAPPDGPQPVCDDLDADGGFGPHADLAVDVDYIYFTRPSVGLIQKCKKP